MSLAKYSSGKVKLSGCLIVLALLLFVAASGFYFLTKSVREAKQLETTLNERFSTASNYVPNADGSISAERVEVFVAVREKTQTVCASYQGVLDTIISINELDKKEDVSREDVEAAGLHSIGEVFSAGSKMVEFTQVRNQALLDNNMGLGEYMNIYLSAYARQLAGETETRYSEMDEAFITKRSRADFVQILSNQLDQLSAQDSLAAVLQDEIESMQNDTQRSAWSNGLPASTAASLKPFQAQLAALYCSGIVKIELLQKNSGLNFDG